MGQEALRALLREKRDAQRQYVETRRASLRSDRESGVRSDSPRENLELLKIELELADTSAEKRVVLEKMVKEARTVEDILIAMRNSGTATGSNADILQARVERLNIQIQLEEAKLKK